MYVSKRRRSISLEISFWKAGNDIIHVTCKDPYAKFHVAVAYNRNANSLYEKLAQCLNEVAQIPEVKPTGEQHNGYHSSKPKRA